MKVTNFLLFCLLGTFLGLTLISAQETRLPVSLSFEYEHPSSSERESKLATTPSQTDSHRLVSREEQRQIANDPDVPSKNLESEVEEEEDKSESIHLGKTLQLNEEMLNTTVQDPEQMNKTTSKNSTIINKEKEKKITKIDEPEFKRAPNTTITHRRNTTINDDRNTRPKKSINVTDEIKDSDTNSTSVTFPNGRGRKNDTKEDNSAASRMTINSGALGIVAFALVIFGILDL